MSYHYKSICANVDIAQSETIVHKDWPEPLIENDWQTIAFYFFICYHWKILHLSFIYNYEKTKGFMHFGSYEMLNTNYFFQIFEIVPVAVTEVQSNIVLSTFYLLAARMNLCKFVCILLLISSLFSLWSS